MTILAIVLLVGIFTPVYYGLLNSKYRHTGIWVTDELLYFCNVEIRGWYRDEMRAMSWIPIPTVKRLMPSPLLERIAVARSMPNVNGLVLFLSDEARGVSAAVKQWRQVHQIVVDVANELGKTFNEIMSNLVAFCKRHGLLDDMEEFK